MSKIPESCSPVNARTAVEAVWVEAEIAVQRTMELGLGGGGGVPDRQR